MYIERLPNEIIAQIFSYLPDVESQAIPNFCSVSKKLAEITNNDYVWERLIPKNMIKTMDNMRLKDFVLKYSIGSEKELVRKIKYFISKMELGRNSVFQCIFKNSEIIFQNTDIKNPSVKLALLFGKSNEETEFHTFIFRNHFTPSCITEVSQSPLAIGEIDFAYFPLNSLPSHLNTMFKNIEKGMSEYQKTSIDKTVKAEEMYLKMKFPSEFKTLSSLLLIESAEYKELNKTVLTKLLKLDKDAQQFQVI